jgi:hypothetical protein
MCQQRQLRDLEKLLAGWFLQLNTARPSLDGHAVFTVIGLKLLMPAFPFLRSGTLKKRFRPIFSSYNFLIPYLEITICDLKF